jgi:hypothetical protein
MDQAIRKLIEHRRRSRQMDRLPPSIDFDDELRREDRAERRLFWRNRRRGWALEMVSGMSSHTHGD